jgi:GAF domain-containing protein/HAMP domain-containing protein
MNKSIQTEVEKTIIPSRPQRSIRTRLLVILVLLVLVPAGIITVVSGIQETRNAEKQITAQLEAVATLKESEINSWLDGLHNELLNTITTEQNNVLISLILENNADLLTYSQTRTNFRKRVALSLYLKEVFLLDRNGVVVLTNERSTISQMDADYSNDPLFLSSLENIKAATVALDVPTSGQISVIIMRQIKNNKGEIIGAIGAIAPLQTLTDVMVERAGLGDTGETYLINPDSVLLTESRFEGYPIGTFKVQTEGAQAGIRATEIGSAIYESYRGEPVIGVYQWIPELSVVFLAEQSRNETLVPIYTTLGIIASSTAVAVFLAIIIGLFLVRGIIRPLEDLTKTATQLASGDLEQIVQLDQNDEIGQLAHAFNMMGTQLRELFGNLEKRVEIRTEELEERNNQLGAIAGLARAIATIRDVEELLSEITQQISERFNYYHVGIFLIDNNKEYAVLRAASSDGGQKMLRRDHRLKVGEVGIVGYVTGSGQTRIAGDVGEEAVYFDNPDLPETLSEMALPLVFSDEIIGALDIQSKESNAFSKEDIEVFLILADQVALAIQNARSLVKAQLALEEADRANQKLTKQAWASFSRSEKIKGYHYLGGKAQPVSEIEEIPALGVLNIPVQIRGQKIANIILEGPTPKHEWTEDELAMVRVAAERAALALENARLLEETQKKAQRETIISDISAKIGESRSVDAIINTTIKELGDALSSPEVSFHLQEHSPSSQKKIEDE